MKNYNKIVGKFGEDIATNFLIKNKYKIIERNYSCKFGEIDIIARYENTIVFVEVKTRTTTKYGSPACAVNYYKQQNIIKTAKYYILNKNIKNLFFRFDVVEVLLYNDDNKFIEKNVNLIKNAFYG